MAGRSLSLLLTHSVKPTVVSRISRVSVITRLNASWEPRDKITHTGQKFDADDRRLVRFIDRPKEVNDRWAINLIDEVSPTSTEARIICCNGGGGPLGHPKVYINLDKPGNHTCGYCGLRFTKEHHH
ncbi:NADH dehydrogenase [ubiquinone] iron-sulfur protein 6, mitochondrial [Diachasma alloeum]|uniref:13 kDa subunit A, NADH-dehydrogenase n=1 Tax=Diachasma alloeum TaxID=454923 RepID=A0A4E0S4L1_9HYME|nr:NADH dehydrogenase [ubiquinone] iron-sulfur protein 6, mitochondrial [Diachasma alloeum]THK33223.1 13 kDA subunit A, NADH-dehydrogenase [Diachasma alloeum]